jgi:hypothetical protein
MTPDPARITADQAAQLPGKRAEDAAWAGVVVPDEAVKFARSIQASLTGAGFKLDTDGAVRVVLSAAAPAIVAASQPKPSDDLRETLTATMQRIRHRALAVEFTDDDGNTVGHMAGGHAAMAAVIALDEFLPLVEAFVAAQCAAARTAALEESLQARCPRVGCPLGVEGDHA